MAVGSAWGQQLRSHVEDYLIDNFTPHVYDQEDGRVRAFSWNVALDIDPTAKRGRRLVSMRVDGDPVRANETYRVAGFKRPGAPPRDLGECGFSFRDIGTVETHPVALLAEYLDAESPVRYQVEWLVDPADCAGPVKNTPVEGSYPYIQPGVDYAGRTEYVQTEWSHEGSTIRTSRSTRSTHLVHHSG